jgi:hypothetical protein
MQIPELNFSYDDRIEGHRIGDLLILANVCANNMVSIPDISEAIQYGYRLGQEQAMASFKLMADNILGNRPIAEEREEYLDEV